ncbi:MAG TPA: 50S ribosomal protein L6, partial [Gemmatimonadaceae bacterium]|nr:50S ribosomal protein L6 [Gemmatimonadaceae bacterium]
MSRIGKKAIPVPKGVTVTVEGNVVKVKGPKGELQRTVHPELSVKLENNELTVSRPSEETRHKALHGLTRTLVANMVEGTSTGFRKTLELVGVGYKAEARPYGLQLALGYSHPIEYKAPKGIKLTAPVPTQILIDGADKEMV